MLRTTFASSRALRVCALGLVTITTAILISSESADARRYKHRRHHHVVRESYSPQFSSIIVDGNSGAVLSSNNPDGIRRPASLTKIMTLYLLFERLESGKMKLDSEMDVSEYASEQAPTKLGLRPGQTLKVEDAIKGLVTRSANDAAVVIAENIAGNEDDFAKLMTRKARALGMSKTTYRNASGLPNDEQLTTARDQAHARPRDPGPLPALLSLLLDQRVSPIAASRSVTTIACSAMSKASTASRPATPAPPASTSSPRCAAATATSSAWCWAVAAAVRATPSCATCSPRTSTRARPNAPSPRSPNANPGDGAVEVAEAETASAGQRRNHGRRTGARRPAHDPLDSARQAVADGRSGCSPAPASRQVRTQQV